MIEITVTDAQVTAAMQRLLCRASHLEPALEAVGAALVARVQEGFVASAAPDGIAWDPLRLRQGQPLEDTGRLRTSINSQVQGGESVAIGTNVLYGVVHQFGATIRARPGVPGENFIGRRYGAPALHWKIGLRYYYAQEVRIPARPFLPLDGLPEEWVTEVVALIEVYVTGDLRPGGTP